MCDFVSWLHEKHGTVNRVWFLTDKDVMDYEGTKNHRLIDWHNYVGHHGIEKVFGPKVATHMEFGIRCGRKHAKNKAVIPRRIAKAIRAGKMQHIMKAGDFSIFEVDANGAVRHVMRQEGIFSRRIEVYFNSKGLRHRTLGPAYIRGYEGPPRDAFLSYQEWFIDGLPMTPDELARARARLKRMKKNSES